jgi:hypothetical protein
MDNFKSKQVTRRDALRTIGVITAAALVRPSFAFAAPVKKSLRFTVVGDWGTGDAAEGGIATRIVSAHAATPLDFVIAAGDNIYPDGSGRHFVKNFETPFSSLLREKMRFYAVLGNHDVRDGRQDQRQYPLFNMGGQCYYTLKQGDGLAEFFMLDSTDFDSAQAAWLDGALKASTAKWKIAVFHHPIYSSGQTHGSDVGLRKQIEPLLLKYGVKAVFSGHDHIYERTQPMQGIQYFVTGAGGQVRKGDTNLKSPFRAVSFDEDNHFMQVEVDESKISFQAVNRSGAIIDSGSIV